MDQILTPVTEWILNTFHYYKWWEQGTIVELRNTNIDDHCNSTIYGRENAEKKDREEEIILENAKGRKLILPSNSSHLLPIIVLPLIRMKEHFLLAVLLISSFHLWITCHVTLNFLQFGYWKFLAKIHFSIHNSFSYLIAQSYSVVLPNLPDILCL